MIYKSYAKINLFLHVCDKLPNNYHALETCFAFINIYDSLEFKIANYNNITYDGEFAKNMPQIENNLIYKVWIFLKNKYNIQNNLSIHLIKNLPSGGGLGGGSSNCAITILAVNDIFKLNMNINEMIEIAIQFGADVPVLLHQYTNNCCFFATGFGEILSPVYFNGNAHILLVNPLVHCDTKQIFNQFKQHYSEKIIHTYSHKNDTDFMNFIKLQKNDLTKTAVEVNSIINEVIVALATTNSIFARMSGSGSTCFAVYHNANEIEEAEQTIKKLFPNFWIKKTNIK
jgi:4-diphosphocytidyl-2-C-methyl-D-erythritol kinase